MEKTYDEQQALVVVASFVMEAATLPDNDDEASTAAAGCGWTEFCGLTGNTLVDIAAPAAAAAPAGL